MMSDINNKIMEAYLSMKVSEDTLQEKKLDPVDDKANDKKFKDRKDKDIDNDGDVDSSDEYLHKKRKATDDAIDGGKKPATNEARQMKDPKKDSMITKDGKTIVVDKSKEGDYLKKGWVLSEAQEEEDDAETDKKPFPFKKKKAVDDEPELDAESEIKKNPKTSDKKAEISKIESIDMRSSFEKMWSEIVEAKNDPKKSAADGEKYDDTASGNDKEFIKMHKKSDKKIEDGEEEGHDVTFKAGGKTMKQSPARSGADNLSNGDKTPKK